MTAETNIDDFSVDNPPGFITYEDLLEVRSVEQMYKVLEDSRAFRYFNDAQDIQTSFFTIKRTMNGIIVDIRVMADKDNVFYKDVPESDFNKMIEMQKIHEVAEIFYNLRVLDNIEENKGVSELTNSDAHLFAMYIEFQRALVYGEDFAIRLYENSRKGSSKESILDLTSVFMYCLPDSTSIFVDREENSNYEKIEAILRRYQAYISNNSGSGEKAIRKEFEDAGLDPD